MRRWAGRACTAAGVGVLVVAVTALSTAFGGPVPPPDKAAGVVRPAPNGSVAALQAELGRVPGNDGAWASLGLAYLEQARVTADPTLYPKAEGALARSLQLRPEDNAPALTGQAVLASARHDFANALALTDTALAINAYSSTTHGVRADALTELGRYDEAQAAVQRMLDLRPDTSALTRASYQLELRGDFVGAQQALEAAGVAAAGPADEVFASFYLGELAWATDPARAGGRYERALEADPGSALALAGRAKTQAAAGDTSGALAGYRAATARLPLTAMVVELGELLEATGDAAGAREQYDLVRAQQQLFAAQGGIVDLELSLFESDHGDPGNALRAAQAAYAARPDAVLVQDALAWALRASGRDAEALPLARAAVRLGTRNPSLWYHLGVVEAAVGDRAAARAALERSLSGNPAWSPLHAPRAAALLAGLV